MAKRQVLIISPGLPYPPIDGHKLKIYNLCSQISNKVDLNLVVITNEDVSLECKIFLDQTFKNYKIFRFNKLQYFFNLIKTVFKIEIPYQVGYYTFSKVKNYLMANCLQMDYVVFNLVRTTGYIDLFTKDKIILDLVDSIGLNYLKSKNNTSSLLYKLIYSLETDRLINHEISLINKAKCTLFVNKSEADHFKQFGTVIYLPNGVNKYLFTIDNCDTKPIVCFFGAMFYQPNIDAVLWFSKNVLPLLNPDIKFYIIGGRPAREVLKLKGEQIIVTDYIENPYFLIKSALCTVAPMQTGGGIQNKILESMAIGQITLTNVKGANPISGHENFHNILIANKPSEFATLINSIYEDPQKYGDIKKNAQKLIKENYSWDKYGEDFLKLFN